jgi:phytanoyl-CoA hydroxylase
MTTTSTIAVRDLELSVDNLDPKRAGEIYKEHGALVVRGLMKPYIAQIREDIEAAAKQAISLLDQAKKVPEGWTTPDGTLWLPAPQGFSRDKQIMVLGCNSKRLSARTLNCL